MRPQIPGLSPGGSGPHLTSSGFPLRAFLRFPVCPPGPSPSSAFFWFPFVRRSPVCSLRPLPGFRFPFGFPPGSLPLSNLTLALPCGGSAGVGPGRQGPTSPVLPRPPRLDRAIRPPCRWAAAGPDGMSPQNRLLRAAASAGHRRARTAQIDASLCQVVRAVFFLVRERAFSAGQLGVVGWWQVREWLGRRAGVRGVSRPRWRQSRSPRALPGTSLLAAVRAASAFRHL